MSCQRCQDLERALEVRRSQFSEALASPYYLVSRRIAAYLGVELERAREELEEHRLVCISVVKQPAALPTVARPYLAQEESQDDYAETAVAC